LREAQLKTLSLPNTAMAVTIDVGDPFDMHPIDKYDVGHRLALVAREAIYGEKIVGYGPLYKSMSVEGDKIILNFTHIGSGLTMGVSPYIPQGEQAPAPPTKLTGFAIAGADREFVWADAVIKGNTVIVSSNKVANPVAVRYAYSNNPVCNLYNKENLPASPFRTDDWSK
jgi:sialate O-acetylesterase